MFSNGGVGGSDKSTEYTEGHEVMEKTIKVIRKWPRVRDFYYGHGRR
jgi:hypothetical protein